MDWLDDLREYGPDIVSVACMEWRRAQTRRPTIADIRALCIREQNDRKAREPVLISPRGDREAYAKSVGWESAADRDAALIREREKDRLRHEEMARDARDRANAWARREGHESFDAYLSVGGTYAKAMRAMAAQAINVMSLGSREMLAALGVTAREFNPSSDELRKDRVKLGME